MQIIQQLCYDELGDDEMTEIRNLDGVQIGHSYRVGHRKGDPDELVVIFYEIQNGNPVVAGPVRQTVTFRDGHMVEETNAGLDRWVEFQVQGY